jgi:hypothetical protein
MQAGADQLRSAGPYPTKVSPNSSAILAITVGTDLQDVLAVVRTAALLSRSFGTKLSIDILGAKNVVMGPEDEGHAGSLTRVLDVVQAELRETPTANTQGFVLEATFTAASFLNASSISVRIHTGSLPLKEGT